MAGRLSSRSNRPCDRLKAMSKRGLVPNSRYFVTSDISRNRIATFRASPTNLRAPRDMPVTPMAPASLVALAREALEACDAVLVRVWTIGPGDSCSGCPMRPECPDQRACLHLALSVGLTTRLDGPFRRF